MSVALAVVCAALVGETVNLWAFGGPKEFSGNCGSSELVGGSKNGVSVNQKHWGQRDFGPSLTFDQLEVNLLAGGDFFLLAA